MNQKETIPGLCLVREPSREERWLSGHLRSGTVTAALPLRGERSTVGVWDEGVGEGTEKVRHERTLKVFPVSYPSVPVPLAWPIPASPGPIPWAEGGELDGTVRPIYLGFSLMSICTTVVRARGILHSPWSKSNLAGTVVV